MEEISWKEGAKIQVTKEDFSQIVDLMKIILVDTSVIVKFLHNLYKQKQDVRASIHFRTVYKLARALKPSQMCLSELINKMLCSAGEEHTSIRNLAKKIIYINGGNSFDFQTFINNGIFF